MASSRISYRPRLAHLTAVGLALALIGAPVKVSIDPPGVAWQSVLAKKGGNGKGGGKGGGNGGGNHGGKGGGPGGGNGGKDHAGHGKSHGQSGKDRHGAKREYRDFDELADDLRSGKAFGHGRRDHRVERAKDRYREAVAKAHGHHAEEADRADPEDREVAHRFSREEAKQLIARGWRARQAPADGFKNHGQRTRTMVALAKRLGYGARVGAMQANFGTPYENGIAELQDQLAEARAAAAADPGDDAAAARVERLNGELAAAIRNAKPGNGPDDSWATADLDVNDDGVVDARDLAAVDHEPDEQAGADEEEATFEGGAEKETSDADGDETPAS